MYKKTKRYSSIVCEICDFAWKSRNKSIIYDITKYGLNYDHWVTKNSCQKDYVLNYIDQEELELDDSNIDKHVFVLILLLFCFIFYYIIKYYK